MSSAKYLLVAAVAAGFAAPASAGVTGTIPATYISRGISFINGYSNNSNALGVISYSSIAQGSASAGAYATPMSRADVSGASGAMGTSIIADVYMTYSFVILSSQVGFADVLINANSGANGVGSYSAFADVDLVGVTNLAHAHACNNTGYCSNVYTSGGTRAFSLRLNKFYTFRLHANGDTVNSFSSFYAFADPTVTFNPAYTAPADAQISFSPGFAPLAGVPEPASWALLLAGFGLVGGMARRDRQIRVVA